MQQAGFPHVAEHTTEGDINVKTSLTRVAILTVSCLLIGFGISADERAEKSSDVEKWRCASASASTMYLVTQNPGHFPEDKVVVRLSRPAGKITGKGEVFVAGILYRADFQMEGFDRRWYFGADREYSFVISPEGAGRYYDFSGVEQGEKIPPSQTYACISSSPDKN